MARFSDGTGSRVKESEYICTHPPNIQTGSLPKFHHKRENCTNTQLKFAEEGRLDIYEEDLSFKSVHDLLARMFTDTSINQVHSFFYKNI